jgi:hypothetical protein
MGMKSHAKSNTLKCCRILGAEVLLRNYVLLRVAIEQSRPNLKDVILSQLTCFHDLIGHRSKVK